MSITYLFVANFYIRPLSAHKIIHRNINKNLAWFFTIFDIIKNCQPASTITTSGWVNFVQLSEVNIFPPVCPCAPFRRTILSHCQTNTLLEYHPLERLHPVNISLFDILPLDVLADINSWLIGIKCHDKYKNAL